MNLTSMIRAGRQVGRDKYKSEEASKLGNLRVGSSGIMSDTGDIAASCHRKALLRSKGIEVDPPDEKKLIMFELGYASEDITTGLLEKALQPGQVILRETEIPIEWQTSNGTRVTGRPDVVLCDQKPWTEFDFETILSVAVPDSLLLRNIPKLGIELKSVHSVWTVREVIFNKTPKLANIVQAAHYMWKLGIPYKLVYKSYSQLGQGMSWSPKMAAMFPTEGSPGSEYMKYNEKGVPLQVDQFEVVYDLDIDQHGRVRYRLEEDSSGKWEYSLVTTHDIERYFQYLSTMDEKKDLGPRPMTLDAVGGKESYDMCGAKYCPLSGICDKHEKSYDVWLSTVRAFIPPATTNIVSMRTIQDLPLTYAEKVIIEGLSKE